MLVLEHLAWKLPDGEPILKDITLTLPTGKLAVVTGPNGGGKTSLAKLIAGLETPSSGRIYLDGEDMTDLNITQRAKKGVAYAFQQPVHFKGLTVRDLLNWLRERSCLTKRCALFWDRLACAHRIIKTGR